MFYLRMFTRLQRYCSLSNICYSRFNTIVGETTDYIKRFYWPDAKQTIDARKYLFEIEIAEKVTDLC